MAARELGHLLDHMIKVLSARRGWAMEYTMDYLGRCLNMAVSTVYKWRQGRHKPDNKSMARLVEIGVAEAGMDRDWAERVLHQGEHPGSAAIMQRLFPAPEAPVSNNLPRRPYIRLVGREAELDEIMQRLAPESRHWLVPIEGVGGLGKSALALEVGWRFIENYERLPSGRRFDAVIWASAKREELTTDGIESYRSSLTNLDDVYRAIADVLEWRAILRAPREE